MPPMKWYWEQYEHSVNSLYLLANKITWLYPSKHWPMHWSDFTPGRVFFGNRKCRSLPRSPWMTCWQGNPISYTNKGFMKFVLQWKLLCMGLKTFPQLHVGNLRCAWTEPDKQQPLGQMQIIRRWLSNWSAKSISANGKPIYKLFQRHQYQLLPEVRTRATGRRIIFTKDLPKMKTAAKDDAYGAATLPTDKRL